MTFERFVDETREPVHVGTYEHVTVRGDVLDEEAREDLAPRESIGAVVHDGDDPASGLLVGVVLVEPRAHPVSERAGALVRAHSVREREAPCLVLDLGIRLEHAEVGHHVVGHLGERDRTRHTSSSASADTSAMLRGCSR